MDVGALRRWCLVVCSPVHCTSYAGGAGRCAGGDTSAGVDVCLGRCDVVVGE